MGFSGGGSGSSSISGSSDTFLSNLINNDTLVYNSATSKWNNGQVSAGGGGLTAAKNTATSGVVTLTWGSSAQLTKFASTLSADRTITLAGTTANAYFDLSFIEMDFNGHTITVTNGTFSHAFSYPTYVRYVYISGAWERVL